MTSDVKAVIDDLKYIADSPDRQYGGFHPQAVGVAQAALAQIEKLSWQAVSDDCLPPLDVPVWLYSTEVGQPLIGCRTEDEGTWCWARCYGDFWFHAGEWKTCTADVDLLKPSHWMALPMPPG